MGNLHLVTGYAGKAHITADDQGSLNAAVFGEGQFVLNRGNKLSASIVTNNQIKVLDGDILMQGRHIRLNSGSFVELAIENGAQGYNRHDLIVARYTKSSSTGVEDCNLIVIKGTATTGAASDPEYTSGDIIGGNALQNDMPLYRVPINGLNVQELVPLFTVIDNRLVDILAHTHEISEIPNLLATLNAKVPTNRTVAGLALSNNITVSQLLTALAHSHAGADLSSAVPVSKGGTGATTAASARSNLGITYPNIGTVPVANGGTGATTAAAARSNLGITYPNIGTVPIANGGTGATNGATGLKNLFAAGYTVISSKQHGKSFPSDAPDGTLFFKEVE